MIRRSFFATAIAAILAPFAMPLPTKKKREFRVLACYGQNPWAATFRRMPHPNDCVAAREAMRRASSELMNQRAIFVPFTEKGNQA